MKTIGLVKYLYLEQEGNLIYEAFIELVTTEALACVTTAIVFDSTPGVEIVADGCGYVAKIGNIYAIKKFIDQVRSDGKE